MQVTFVSATTGMAGGIKVVVIYARALARMGHVVRVVSPPPQAVPLRRKFRSLLLGKGWPGNPPPRQSHFEGSGLDHHVLERWRPVTDADLPDADVVIATWWETAEWVNALSPRKGAKVYFVQHHEVFPMLPLGRVRATYRLPLHKIVIAKWLKDVMEQEYGDSITDLVSNSVDHEQFFAPPRTQQPRPTVGFMYSRAVFKGVDVALKAIRRLRELIPGLRVISFGTHQPHGDGLFDQSIEFQFSPPQDKLRDLYALCDVWLAASRSEGFNLPAMEAMACRTPVVSTRTGWPEEAIVTGTNGVLVEVDDIDGLVRGAKWVLSRSADEWKSLSERAYQTTLASSWAESARQFERALLHACRRSQAGEIGGKCGIALAAISSVAD